MGASISHDSRTGLVVPLHRKDTSLLPPPPPPPPYNRSLPRCMAQTLNRNDTFTPRALPCPIKQRPTVRGKPPPSVQKVDSSQTRGAVNRIAPPLGKLAVEGLTGKVRYVQRQYPPGQPPASPAKFLTTGAEVSYFYPDSGDRPTNTNYV